MEMYCQNVLWGAVWESLVYTFKFYYVSESPGETNYPGPVPDFHSEDLVGPEYVCTYPR